MLLLRYNAIVRSYVRYLPLYFGRVDGNCTHMRLLRNNAPLRRRFRYKPIYFQSQKNHTLLMYGLVFPAMLSLYTNLPYTNPMSKISLDVHFPLIVSVFRLKITSSHPISIPLSGIIFKPIQLIYIAVRLRMGLYVCILQHTICVSHSYLFI